MSYFVNMKLSSPRRYKTNNISNIRLYRKAKQVWHMICSTDLETGYSKWILSSNSNEWKKALSRTSVENVKIPIFYNLG